MRIIFAFILCLCSLVNHAQSISPLMSAGVKYSINDTNNSYFLSPDQASKGYYENIELLEIDNTLVLRSEEGKSNEYGFVDEGSVHSIMFKITNLTYEWIDPVRQEGVLFKGICSNKQLGYDLPLILRFNISGDDVLSVGHNVKTLYEVRNYDLNKLFVLGKEVRRNNNATPSNTYKKNIIKKHKPKLTK